MSKSYSEKLRDPRWQKMRLKVFERDEWRCQLCSDETKTLHVHHRYYMKVEPWEYPHDALMTLCEECHDGETEDLKTLESDLITILRKNFIARDIYTIASAFAHMSLGHVPCVVADTIAFCLLNEDIQNSMIGLWLNHEMPDKREKDEQETQRTGTGD